MERLLRELVTLVPKAVRVTIYGLPYGYRLKKWVEMLFTCKAYRWYPFRKGPRRGMRMKLKLPDDNEFFLETHDPHVTDFLSNHIQPGSTVVEVGAHIGYYTLILSRKVGVKGRVLALEPLPANVTRLREHLRVNQCEDNCTVLEMAGGAKDEDLEFLQFPASTIGRLADGDSELAKAATARLIVKCRTLDSLALEGMIPFPDFVKIDVEGSEVEVLSGMVSILQKSKPALLIEIHHDRAAQHVSGLLSNLGYGAYRIENRQPVSSSLDNLVGLNVLFAPWGRTF